MSISKFEAQGTCSFASMERVDFRDFSGCGQMGPGYLSVNLSTQVLGALIFQPTEVGKSGLNHGHWLYPCPSLFAKNIGCFKNC